MSARIRPITAATEAYRATLWKVSLKLARTEVGNGIEVTWQAQIEHQKCDSVFHIAPENGKYRYIPSRIYDRIPDTAVDTMVPESYNSTEVR